MFTVGEKVVALRSWPEDGVFEGEIYTVTGVFYCMCGGSNAISIGTSDGCRYGCEKCMSCIHNGEITYGFSNFAPLEDIEAMNEFFNKITEPEHVEV